METVLRTIASFFQHRYIHATAILFSTFFLLCGIGMGVRYYYLHKTLVPAYQLVLDKKLNEQVNSINVLLDEHKNNLDKLANDDFILSYMENNRDKKQVSGQEEANFISHIQKQQENMDFKSLSLITNDGTIIFSTTPALRNIKLTDETNNKTPLYRSFYASLMTLAPDFSEVLYSSILNETVFYITTPLFKNKKIIGSIAYRIDEQKLYLITRDYIDLGETGEILIAVQTGTEAFIITPTRQDPLLTFTRQELFKTKELLPIQRAARGEHGIGLGYDYKNNKTVAAWNFIPRVDWGIVVKINFDEVMQPLSKCYMYLITFLCIAFFFGLFTLFSYYLEVVRAAMAINNRFFSSVPSQLKTPLFPVFLLCVFFAVRSVYNFRYATSLAINSSKDLACNDIDQGIQAIDTELNKIRVLGNFIAQDLQAERLISEDIKKRIKRDIIETDGLVSITIAFAPYVYNKDTKLYAPSVTQAEDGSLVEQMVDQLYDYTNKEEGVIKTAWYTQTIEMGKAQLLNPHYDPISKIMVITYALPFCFNANTAAGVISITYKLSELTMIAQNIGVGKTGYTFITSSDGTFIYHPIQRNVSDKKTLLQFAQEQGNKELALIATDVKNQKSLLKSFVNETTQDTSWICAKPINTTGWMIGTIFSQHEIGLSSYLTRQYLFMIVLFNALMLLALLAFCAVFTLHSLRNFLTSSNLVLTVAILCLWYIIEITSYTNLATSIPITDQSSLNKFITKQAEEAKRKNEAPPIPIPCGILLYSLEQINPMHVSFSGYIWHKYHRTLHKDIQRAIYIPQATYFRVSNEIKVAEGDWDIVGLNVVATLYHEHNYMHYPFDEHHIIIPLDHADVTKNIILVPDLAGYTTVNPAQTPGLDKSFSPTGFHVKETFFNFIKRTLNADLGVRQYLERTDHFQLSYNAILYGDLLSPFIFFFLPLLVILISIFSILILEKRQTDPYTLIGPYTGLFFALVLLHRSLHEAAPSTQTLYIEYSFFFTYIVIILLVIHTILAQYYIDWDFYQKTLITFFKNIFWPLQLISWIVTTLIMFY